MSCTENAFILAELAREFVSAEIKYKKVIGKGECNEELHNSVRNRDRLFKLMREASECNGY